MDQEFYLIKDKLQFERFLRILPEAIEDQVYFISLSARNKYLTETEREHYKLGRTEMFARTVVQSKPEFNKAMNELAGKLQTRTTKSGLSYPSKCLVVYVNVNTSSMVKAYQAFQQAMNHELYNIMGALQNSKKPNYDGFVKMQRRLLNEIQKATAYKYFIDIDFDTNNIEIVADVTDQLYLHGIKYHVIKTHGGWHVLIARNTITRGLRLDLLVKEANSRAVDGEVIFNTNQMIPMPGTMQADHLVQLL